MIRMKIVFLDSITYFGFYSDGIYVYIYIFICNDDLYDLICALYIGAHSYGAKTTTILTISV